MDGNTYGPARFKIDAVFITYSEKKYDWFTLDRRHVETTRVSVFGQKDVTSWARMGTFKTLEDARAHYELIKDLPEYLP